MFVLFRVIYPKQTASNGLVTAGKRERYFRSSCFVKRGLTRGRADLTEYEVSRSNDYAFITQSIMIFWLNLCLVIGYRGVIVRHMCVNETVWGKMSNDRRCITLCLYMPY